MPNKLAHFAIEAENVERARAFINPYLIGSSSLGDRRIFISFMRLAYTAPYKSEQAHQRRGDTALNARSLWMIYAPV